MPDQSTAKIDALEALQIRRLLILDTETTGFRPEDGAICIEVGAILFDVPARAVVSQISFLLPCLDNPARHVNGIDPALSAIVPDPTDGIAYLMSMIQTADAVLAHNAAFDQQWFGLGHLPRIDKPWICSMDDIRWPADRNIRNRPGVKDLALAYGVPVWAAHRALTDCIYLAQVLERVDDLEALLISAQQPRKQYRAIVSYDDRQLAKDAGFSWNKDLRAWLRRMTEAEMMDLRFPVEEVPE